MTDYYDISTIDSNMLDGLFAFFAGLWLFLLIIGIFAIVVNWKIYKKAGKEGWEILIPIYNIWVLYEIVGLKGWYSLLIFIPLIGPIIAMVFTVIAYVKLAKCFGKNPMFAVGLIFLSPIFLAILAFGKSEYKLVKEPVIQI
jgi:hypothetical protein